MIDGREEQAPGHLARGRADPIGDVLVGGRHAGLVLRGQVAVDVLDHDDRRIDDDAEIDRPDRQQVGRLAADVQHGEGEQQGQRNVDRHDQGRPDVAQEHQQDRRHQGHADEQVLVDRLGREVDQVGAVVVRDDLHARRQVAGLVQLLDLGQHVLQRGQRFLPLAQQDDALDHVVLVVPDRSAVGVENGFPVGVLPRPADADPPLAGLVRNDDAACDQMSVVHPRCAVGVEQRPAVHQMIDADRDVVHAGHDDLPNLAAPAGFLRPQEPSGLAWVGHRQDLLVRVLALPDQPERADDDDRLALGQVVAAAVGVRVARARSGAGPA